MEPAGPWQITWADSVNVDFRILPLGFCRRVPVQGSFGRGHVGPAMPVITYEVAISIGPGAFRLHKFSHHAPANLHEIALPYIQGLVAAHTTELLEAGPYRCVGCSRTANDLLHKPQLSCSETSPRVIDFAQPVCQENTTCDLIARHRIQAYLDKIQGDRTAPMYDYRSCAMCGVEKGNAHGTQAGMQQCGRCKALSYCSKSCQRAHWPVHKRACVDGITLPAEWGFG